jgi:purine/pyrimidine-nucleoside phosphorylase
MFTVNEYYNGLVKSIGFQNNAGKFTVGVMATGEYEFNTNSKEFMTIVSGQMKVLLPDQQEWKTYSPFETFIVPKDSKFSIIVEDTACSYLCRYE